MKEAIIFCVDDEVIVLKSLRRELREALGNDYLIETSENGEEALHVLQELLANQHDVPVIISDHVMPGMKGDELLKQVHAISPKTRKIMLTGQANIQAITNAVNYANLYRYISKPWEKTDLCLTVKEAIQSYFQAQKLEAQHETLQKLYTQAQQEIAERKRVENALRKSEANIRAIVEAAADGIITFDHQGIVTSFNPAAERIFGYQAQDLIGQPLSALIPTSAHAEFDRYQVHTHDPGKEITICIGREINGRRNNGELFPVDFTVSEIRMGDQQMFTGFVRDITERRKAEQERVQLATIQSELKIAHDIQQSLLPDPKPDWQALDVICYTAPAREVGGDFYSYHARDAIGHAVAKPSNPGQKFALAIGDVSGKGISAALLMATVLSQFETSFAFDFAPAERVAHLDHVVSPYTKSRYQNCALCYVELDLTDTDLRAFRKKHAPLPMRVVNAGGIPPYIKRTDGSVEWLDVGGVPLGFGIGATLGYQEVSVSLLSGDMVILTSDGVAEANALSDEMFGFERLEAAIRKAPITSAQAMLEYLKAELAAFVGRAEPYDDVTMIVFRV